MGVASDDDVDLFYSPRDGVIGFISAVRDQNQYVGLTRQFGGYPAGGLYLVEDSNPLTGGGVGAGVARNQPEHGDVDRPDFVYGIRLHQGLAGFLDGVGTQDWEASLR